MLGMARAIPSIGIDASNNSPAPDLVVHRIDRRLRGFHLLGIKALGWGCRRRRHPHHCSTIVGGGITEVHLPVHVDLGLDPDLNGVTLRQGRVGNLHHPGWLGHIATLPATPAAIPGEEVSMALGGTEGIAFGLKGNWSDD